MEQNEIQTDLLSKEELEANRNTQYNCLHPDSWVWDEEKVSWVAPKNYPNDGFPYIWNEQKLDWIPFPDYPRN
jgi:hypothetical protein